MTTMIALVGGQPQPNYLPVLHTMPEHVVLIYTQGSLRPYNNLKIAIEQKGISVEGIQTDPYDIAAIASAIEQGLAADTQFVFNLTGGTKPMSLAAAQVAAQRNAPVIYLQSEKKESILYHYNWQHQRLNFQRQERLTQHLSLTEMLHLQVGPKKDANGETVWTEHGPDLHFDGGYFELAIARTLKDNNYETMGGFKGPNGKPEIDVIVRDQNQIGIIEAKTGKGSTNFDGIKQLSLSARFLGATFTRTFLVLDRLPDDHQKIICEALNIQIISLPNYQPRTETLSAEDQQTLLTAVDQALRPTPDK